MIKAEFCAPDDCDPAQCKPERLLLSKVLDRALQDYCGESYMSRGHHKDARLWIFSDSEEPFSFLWVCISLDFDPQRLRDELKGLTGYKGIWSKRT